MAQMSLPPLTRRLFTLVAGALVAGAAFVGPRAPAPVGAQTAPGPHWGPYQWSGGSQHADVRAFWLFDRTGDAQMHATIRSVVSAWNSARNKFPELPFIGLYVDDANAGNCFLNRTPGYSVASACMIPDNFLQGIQGLTVTNPGADGHLIGAAFAVSRGLSNDDALTVVCHNFGLVLGLPHSANPASCMSDNFISGTAKWYDQDDAVAILDLYDHDDSASPPTSSTVASSSTTSSTTVSSTTEPSTSSTTVASSTTSSTVGSSSSTSSTTVASSSTSTSITLPVSVSTIVPTSLP